MNRTTVQSSRILSIGWDKNTLEVEFKGNSIYQYSPVELCVFEKMLTSFSVGKDIEEIKNNKEIICHKIFPLPQPISQNEAKSAPPKWSK